MKRCLPLLMVVFLCGGWLTQSLPAQRIDLVKLRKEEAERRKKLKKTPKQRIQVNNTNVKEIAKKTRPLGYTESSDQEQSGEQKPKAEGEARPLDMAGQPSSDTPVDTAPSAETEKRNPEYWQRLKRNLEEGIADQENRIRQNESRLNLLHTQYLTQDLPLEKQRIKTELDNLREQDKQDRQRLQELHQELEALKERARRAGVPPGWLR